MVIPTIHAITPLLISFFRLAGVNFSPLIKTAVIGFLTQMTAGVCTDAGQQAMAKMTEFCGGLLALYTALPLAEQLLQVLEEMMHG